MEPETIFVIMRTFYIDSEEFREVVKVDDFDKDRWNECAPGIHCFITRQEAVNYG